MVKGVAVKFSSYEDTVPKLLKLIKLDNELKRHEKIVLKPVLTSDSSKSTPVAFVEAVLKYCSEHKNPGSEIFIAEGADGADTQDLFDEQGYRTVAEKYHVGLVDLNTAETEEIGKNEFVGFEQIAYPSILKNSFVVTLPVARVDEKLQMMGSLASMLGAFPSRHYRGFLSRRKNKLDAYPIKYQVHDINLCKIPNLALVDAHDRGVLLAGNPIEIDKQLAKLFGFDWRSVGYLRMLDETLSTMAEKAELAKPVAENR